MKKVFFLSLIISIFALSACEPKEDTPESKGSIYGIISDYITGEPVRNANVTLNPLGKSTTTGSDGSFEFNDIEADEYTVYVVANGYRTETKTVVVQKSKTVRCDMQMKRSGAQLYVDKTVIVFEPTLSSASIKLQNLGTEELNFNIDDSEVSDFMTLSNISGVIGASDYINLTLNLDRNSIANEMKRTIYIKSDGGDINIIVDIRVEQQGGSNPGTDPDPDPEEKPSVINPYSKDLDISNFYCVGYPGGTVEFYFTVTNNSSTKEYYFAWITAYAPDGTSYTTGSVGYVGKVNLPQYTPVKIEYNGTYTALRDVSENTKKFTTITLDLYPTNNYQDKSLTFRNIPIEWQ